MNILNITLLLLLSPVFAAWGQDTDHQNEHKSRPWASVIMAQSEPDLLLATLENFRREAGLPVVPTLVSLEPGPHTTRHGLRLLPHEVFPSVSVPHQLLLISTLGDLKINHSILAMIRRCMNEGVTVQLVGAHIPDELLDFPLEPGRRIHLCTLAQLGDRLRHLYGRQQAGQVVIPFN